MNAHCQIALVSIPLSDATFSQCYDASLAVSPASNPSFRVLRTTPRSWAGSETSPSGSVSPKRGVWDRGPGRRRHRGDRPRRR